MAPKVGDKVKIVASIYWHQFPIGSFATIKEDCTNTSNDYLLVSEDYPDGFMLTTEEFEEIKG